MRETHLESVVDSSTTVEDAQDLSGLTARMEGKRQLKQVVEGEL